MTNKKITYKPISAEILEIAERHHNQSEAVLEILKDIQNEHSGLTRESITDVARAVGLPPHHTYGMTTFYSMLSTKQRKKVLRVCDGPVCWLQRANQTRTAIEKIAGTEDGAVVERTSCLGLCDRAPAVRVYDGLKTALHTQPAVVLDIVESSGLQGRGGAGFPVGRKWRFVASEKQTP